MFGTSDGAAAERQLFHGLYWLAADLAEKGPVLLALDDTHWADQASRRWLVYLLSGLEGLAVAVDGLGGEASSNSPTAEADSGGKREFRLQRTAPATF